MCKDVKSRMDLRKGPDTPMVRFATLVYNAFAMEVRDMFRIFDSLSRCKVEVAKFYEWFEGFFEMVKTIMAAFDNIVFTSSSNKKNCRREQDERCHREHKKQRIRQQCFDILDLYQKQKSRIENDLFMDLSYELELLALNVLTYFHVQVETMPAALSCFSTYELNELEVQLVDYLIKSDQGRFMLCAIVRSFKEDEEEEEGNGDAVVSTTGIPNASTGVRCHQLQEYENGQEQQQQVTDRKKEYEKMFRTLHVDFVDMFALHKMNIRVSYRSCKSIDDAFASMMLIT